MAKVMRQIRRVKPKTEGLRGFWSNSWTQRGMAVMVFLVLAWVHYQLAHLLISVKINNGQCQDCNLVKALPQQTLMMSHIIDDKIKPLRPVFMWGPIQGGIVHFNKARLDDTLLANLQRFQPDIPTAPQPVDFNVTSDQNSKVYIKIYFRKYDPLNKLFFVRESSSENLQTEFKMRAEGLGLAVEISQLSLTDSGSMNAANILKIGGWRYKLAGMPITLLPENGTDSIFRFFSAESATPDNNKIITALTVGATEFSGDIQTFDTLLCGAPESGKVLLTFATKLVHEGCPNTKQIAPLKLTGLAIDKDYVQISASGNAWVLSKGEPVSKDINVLIKENPYLAALLAIFDAFAIAWLKRVFGQKK